MKCHFVDSDVINTFNYSSLHCCFFRLVLTECDPNVCPSGDTCTNQKIQRHQWHDGLEKFDTKERGIGVTTTQQIPQGLYFIKHSFVMWYIFLLTYGVLHIMYTNSSCWDTYYCAYNTQDMFIPNVLLILKQFVPSDYLRCWFVLYTYLTSNTLNEKRFNIWKLIIHYTNSFLGGFILEYLGEVVSENEFRRRMTEEYSTECHHYCLHLDSTMVIDGYRMGSIGRFVNHSCDPNCEMQKW